MMLKPIAKKIVGPRIWRLLKTISGRSTLDEVDIVFELLIGKESSKIMIDVGAHHGGSLEQFAADGWQVYAFEPDPNNRKALTAFCSKYPRVQIDSRAVSNQLQKKLPFYTSDVSTGISSLSSFHDTHEESSTVDTVTLESFVEEASIQDVDFLKIDTEGHDLFVLQGIPWDKIKPRVILCEFEDRKTKSLGYDFHNLAKYLVSKGYSLLVSEWCPMQEYGTRHKWRRFSGYPCELLDTKAWGNIIAVKEKELKKYLSGISQNYEQRFGHRIEGSRS